METNTLSGKDDFLTVNDKDILRIMSKIINELHQIGNPKFTEQENQSLNVLKMSVKQYIASNIQCHLDTLNRMITRFNELMNSLSVKNRILNARNLTNEFPFVLNTESGDCDYNTFIWNSSRLTNLIDNIVDAVEHINKYG